MFATTTRTNKKDFPPRVLNSTYLSLWLIILNLLRSIMDKGVAIDCSQSPIFPCGCRGRSLRSRGRHLGFSWRAKTLQPHGKIGDCEQSTVAECRNSYPPPTHTPEINVLFLNFIRNFRSKQVWLKNWRPWQRLWEQVNKVQQIPYTGFFYSSSWEAL